jgi:hypothetical protein
MTSDWRYLLWPVGTLFAVLAAFYAGIWLWRQRQNQAEDLLFLVEQALWSFRSPLLIVTIPSLVLITMGLAAGSQVSMILFVLLSAITVVGIGGIAWWLWPKDAAEGNLFDMIPMPHLEWPAFENRRDKLMRAWVEQKTREIKSNPPDFSGAVFGSIALEISQEAAVIYDKKTPLSVSVDELLRGLERTAADLKILTNHLPLASRLTLAEIERQIEFAIKRGRTLYALVFLVMSFFNPGNLLRVVLAFFQQKSPWEHLLKELQGWIYAHYTERLGYHMSLIHSGRQPPEQDSLKEAVQSHQARREEAVRNQKLGWLAFMGLFGFALYLLLQLINATLVFGLAALLPGLCLVGLCGYGVWGLRAPHRWERLWTAILPQWPDTPPEESANDTRARQQMAAVLHQHKTPPKLEQLADAKQLPGIYGELFVELWEACYTAYRPADETDESRTSREFYLPQAFAGIEELCHSLHVWFAGNTTIPKTLRQLERVGFNLETLYHRLQSNESDDNEPKQLPDTTETNDVEQPEAVGEDAEGEPNDASQQKGTFRRWLGKMGRSVKGFLTDMAIGQLHKAVLQKYEDDLADRLLNIYGARYTRSTFEPKEPIQQMRSILLIGRELSQLEHLRVALRQHAGAALTEVQEQLKTTEDKHTHTMLTLQTADGTFVGLDAMPFPGEERTEEEFTEQLTEAMQLRQYQYVLLVDTIDYGAKERVLDLLTRTFLDPFRTSRIQGIALVLTGVENLKPLSWSPPYDDYLLERPTQRKSQRIRNAVLAWAKCFQELDAMDTIYPVGLPKEGDKWGLKSIHKYCELPLDTTDAKKILPSDDNDVTDQDLHPYPSTEANAEQSTNDTPQADNAVELASQTEPAQPETKD